MNKERMQKLAGIIKENTASTYEYGCVMLYFGFPMMNKIHDGIDPNDVYTEEANQTYGLEDEPHCTLLFGLHDNELDTNTVIKIATNFEYPSVVAHNVSMFQNEKYDVLKFDIKGDGLHSANKELRKFPHTNSFPDYHPHMTIAYLKPNTGQKYVDRMKNQSYQLKPTHIVYSHPDGSRDTIKVK
jgi:2'-5' RNA ligase